MSHLLENALIAGVLLCIFIIPVMLIIRQNRKKRKQRMAALLQTTLDIYRLELEKSGEIGGRFVGWDNTQRTLLLIADSDSQPELIALEKAVRCDVIKDYQSAAVQAILLQFSDSRNQPMYKLSLYHQYKDNEMHLRSIEVQADEWKNWLNARLN
jgi:ferric iron reductase protein FhuF